MEVEITEVEVTTSTNDSSEGDNPKTYERLRVFNLIMGFVHFIQAIVMIAISSDFSVSITTSFLNSSLDSQTGEFTSTSVPEEIGEVQVGLLVALFLLLSAGAHFLIAVPGINEWYNRNLKKGMNLARWYEYSLSSSLMIVVIGLLVGILDAPSLILLFFVNWSMIMFGYVMEVQNQGRTKENVDWRAFIFGTIAGLIPWIVIAWYFVGAIEGFEGENPIPDFVYGILISLFIFFNIFAVNMYLQYKRIGPWKDYIFGEKMYIVLSLLAKSALAWQVWSGTLRDN